MSPGHNELTFNSEFCQWMGMGMNMGDIRCNQMTYVVSSWLMLCHRWPWWVFLSFHPCIHLSMDLGLGIYWKIAWKVWSRFCHADVFRWLTLRLSTVMGIIVCLSVRLAIFICVSWGRGGLLSLLGDDCCHHWRICGMSVAIIGITF